MLPRPQSPSSSPRQTRRSLFFKQSLKQPMFWGTAGVILLSGLFLIENWQPRSAVNSSAAKATRHSNPLLDQGSSDSAASYSGGEPDLPRSVLPGEPNTPLPIDPNLPLLAGQSAQDKAQTERNSHSSANLLVPFSPGKASSTDRNRSEDLYNPTGIPLPESWQTRSSRRQPQSQIPAEAQSLPEAASPLQSGLDRMRAPLVNQSGSPQSSPTLQNGSSTGGIGAESMETGSMPGVLNGGLNRGVGTGMTGTGAIGTGQPPLSPMLPQSSSQSVPHSTGYTLPPAFRTTGNTTSFYGSPAASPVQSATPDPAASLSPSPGSPSMSSNPGQPNPGQPMGSGSGEIGNGEINTFSNP